MLSTNSLQSKLQYDDSISLGQQLQDSSCPSTPNHALKAMVTGGGSECLVPKSPQATIQQTAIGTINENLGDVNTSLFETDGVLLVVDFQARGQNVQIYLKRRTNRTWVLYESVRLAVDLADGRKYKGSIALSGVVSFQGQTGTYSNTNLAGSQIAACVSQYPDTFDTLTQAGLGQIARKGPSAAVASTARDPVYVMMSPQGGNTLTLRLPTGFDGGKISGSGLTFDKAQNIVFEPEDQPLLFNLGQGVIFGYDLINDDYAPFQRRAGVVFGVAAQFSIASSVPNPTPSPYIAKVRAYYQFYNKSTNTINTFEDFDLGFGVTSAPNVVTFPQSSVKFMPRAPMTRIEIIAETLDAQVQFGKVEIIQFNTGGGEVSAPLTLAIMEGLPAETTIVVTAKQTYAVAPANSVMTLVQQSMSVPTQNQLILTEVAGRFIELCMEGMQLDYAMTSTQYFELLDIVQTFGGQNAHGGIRNDHVWKRLMHKVHDVFPQVRKVVRKALEMGAKADPRIGLGLDAIDTVKGMVNSFKNSHSYVKLCAQGLPGLVPAEPNRKRFLVRVGDRTWPLACDSHISSHRLHSLAQGYVTTPSYLLTESGVLRPSAQQILDGEVVHVLPCYQVFVKGVQVHIIWVHPGMQWRELREQLLSAVSAELGPDVQFVMGAKTLAGFDDDVTAHDLGVYKERTVVAYVPLRGGSSTYETRYEDAFQRIQKAIVRNSERSQNLGQLLKAKLQEAEAMRAEREQLLMDTQSGILAAQKELTELEEQFSKLRKDYTDNKTTLSAMMKQQEKMEADNLELLNVIELLTNISAGVDVSVDIDQIPSPWSLLVQRFADATSNTYNLMQSFLQDVEQNQNDVAIQVLTESRVLPTPEEFKAVKNELVIAGSKVPHDPVGSTRAPADSVDRLQSSIAQVQNLAQIPMVEPAANGVAGRHSIESNGRMKVRKVHSSQAFSNLFEDLPTRSQAKAFFQNPLPEYAKLHAWIRLLTRLKQRKALDVEEAPTENADQAQTLAHILSHGTKKHSDAIASMPKVDRLISESASYQKLMNSSSNQDGTINAHLPSLNGLGAQFRESGDAYDLESSSIATEDDYAADGEDFREFEAILNRNGLQYPQVSSEYIENQWKGQRGRQFRKLLQRRRENDARSSTSPAGGDEQPTVLLDESGAEMLSVPQSPALQNKLDDQQKMGSIDRSPAQPIQAQEKDRRQGKVMESKDILVYGSEDATSNRDFEEIERISNDLSKPAQVQVNPIKQRAFVETKDILTYGSEDAASSNQDLMETKPPISTPLIEPELATVPTVKRPRKSMFGSGEGAQDLREQSSDSDDNGTFNSHQWSAIKSSDAFNGIEFDNSEEPFVTEDKSYNVPIVVLGGQGILAQNAYNQKIGTMERYVQSFTFGATRSGGVNGDQPAPAFVGWVSPRALAIPDRRAIEVLVPANVLSKWLKVPVAVSYGLRLYSDDKGIDRDAAIQVLCMLINAASVKNIAPVEGTQLWTVWLPPNQSGSSWMAACEAAVLGLNPTNIYAGSVEPSYVGLQTQYRPQAADDATLRAETEQYIKKYEGSLSEIVLPAAQCVMLYPEDEVTTFGRFIRTAVEKKLTTFTQFYTEYYKDRKELYVQKRNYNQFVVCDLSAYAMYGILKGKYTSDSVSLNVYPRPTAKWFLALSSQQLITLCKPLKQRLRTLQERQQIRGLKRTEMLLSNPEQVLPKHYKKQMLKQERLISELNLDVLESADMSKFTQYANLFVPEAGVNASMLADTIAALKPKFDTTIKRVRAFVSQQGTLPDPLVLVRQNYVNNPLFKMPNIDDRAVPIENFLPRLVTFLRDPKPDGELTAFTAARVQKFFGNYPFLPGSSKYSGTLFIILVKLRDLIEMQYVQWTGSEGDWNIPLTYSCMNGVLDESLVHTVKASGMAEFTTIDHAVQLLKAQQTAAAMKAARDQSIAKARAQNNPVK